MKRKLCDFERIYERISLSESLYEQGRSLYDNLLDLLSVIYLNVPELCFRIRPVSRLPLKSQV